MSEQFGGRQCYARYVTVMCINRWILIFMLQLDVISVKPLTRVESVFSLVYMFFFGSKEKTVWYQFEKNLN